MASVHQGQQGGASEHNDGQSENCENAAASVDDTPHQISTFIFLDLETSALHDFEKPKIIELCMIAVHRNALCSDTTSGKLPRVLDKITLCFNPNKHVNPKTYELTGLDNINIVQESGKEIFDEDAVQLLKLFLRRQQQPVCLVAHNGERFDFRLLRTELQKLGQSLGENVLCADTYLGFYETDFEVNPDQKAQNNGHTTPKRMRLNQSGAAPTTPSKYKGVIESPLSYSLANVFERTFNKESVKAHTAEGDVVSLIRICQSRGKRLCDWMDRKAMRFNDMELYYMPSPPRGSKRRLQFSD